MSEMVILDDVRTDGGTQPREYLNELVLSEYAESMTDGTEFPPVVIFFDGSHHWLADGFHRFFAAKKCGTLDIAADVRQGTRRDAKLYAVGANAVHGLRRTNVDKRRAALALLQDEEWQRWSNREIARQCGVTHTFVAKLRRELVEASPAETPASNAAAARPESMDVEPLDVGPLDVGSLDVAEPPRLASVVLSDATYTGDETFEAPAARSRHDLFDQLAPSEPPSTPTSTMERLGMVRLGFEHREPLAEPDTIDSDTPAVAHSVIPKAVVPTASAPSPDLAPASEARVTIEAMAATSQQEPVEWVAEMMVYWLLDLGAQYEGMTPELVRRAADKLGQQYAQACEEIAPPS